jgi:predicted dehydrogenase
MTMNAINVGIAGLGRAGWGMIFEEIRNREDIRVVAGADVLPDRTAELHAACGAAEHADLPSLLADDAVEVVVIATRSSDHAAMAELALEAGKHVVVEKPMATRLADADRLIEQAGRSAGQLLVRHNRRFDPPLIHSQKLIASGKIGEVFRVQLRQSGYQQRSDWQAIRAFGGGQLLNWGPHLVDWATQLVGGPARDVWVDTRRVAAVGDAEDHINLMWRGPSGAVADVEVSGAAAVSQPAWHVLGTHGGFTIDGRQVTLRHFDPAAVDPPAVSDQTPVRGQGFGRERSAIPWEEASYEIPNDDARPAAELFWDAVVAAVRQDQPFPITLDQARENMRVLDLASRAAMTAG